MNLAYHEIANQRAKFCVLAGDNGLAKTELGRLQTDLAVSGVKQAVLDDIQRYEQEIL